MATPSISRLTIARRDPQIGAANFMLVNLTRGIVSDNTRVNSDWRSRRSSCRHQFVDIGRSIHYWLTDGFLRLVSFWRLLLLRRRLRLLNQRIGSEIWHSSWSHVKVRLFPINGNKLVASSCCFGNDHI